MPDTYSDDFRAAIQRHFEPLISSFGFEFVMGESGAGGIYLLQILASPQIQVKLNREYDYLDISLASSDAPRVWQDDPGGITRWHSAILMIGYENRRNPELAYRIPSLDQKMDSGERDLAGWALLLQAYLPRLLPAFSATPPQGWWEGFRASRAARSA